MDKNPTIQKHKIDDYIIADSAVVEVMSETVSVANSLYDLLLEMRKSVCIKNVNCLSIDDNIKDYGVFNATNLATFFKYMVLEILQILRK